MSIIVASDPACPDTALFAWDTGWRKESGTGDWMRNARTGINAGGLRTSQAIETEIICCLFTDRRCPPDHPLSHFADGDLRGYWGDALAALNGEPERSSLLWLLERATCTEENRRWAEIFALDALAPLISAGVAVRATADAVILPARNGINLAIGLFGRDGRERHKARYDILWAGRR